MATTSAQHLSPVAAARLKALLTREQDAHRRQRELVRASLFLCPRTSR